MIPFAPPRIDQLIIDEVVSVLKSGWITTGPRTKEFEKKLTAYCGNKATLCLNSATSGLELMLRWYGVKTGDEVIIPAYTYASTANVVLHCGATPVMVDITDNFLIDIENIRNAVTIKTKVIIPVDFGGFPCDYDSINEMVQSSGIKWLFQPQTKVQEQLGRILVLSDAAHSLGATCNNKKAGSLTDVTVFSFHAVKNLTTAEGGAIALNLPAPFNNDEIYSFLSALSLHGQNKDALTKMQKGNWRYDIITPGYKCNMTDIAAAIGLVELNRYDRDTLPRRKAICDLYNAYFEGFSWATTPIFRLNGFESSYHLYALRINNINELQRDAIIGKIFEKDVAVNVHFMPLPLLSYYRSIGFSINDYPVSYKTYAAEISLPVYFELTENQIERVCEVVKNAVIESLKEVNAFYQVNG